MRRRQALSLLAGSALGAGCIERSGPSTGTTPTDAPTTDAPTTETPPTTDENRTFAVESVETFAYAIRLNDLGNSPGGQIPDFADLDDRERAVVADAIDGGYAVEDPPDWLVKFLSATPWVLREGTYYRLEHTLATHEITAEAVDEGAVDGEIASYETYEEAVTHDGVVTSGLMRLARRDGFPLTYVWPSLREFLDEYDAVRYRGEVLDFTETVDDPGPPYEVAAERVSPADLADASTWDATDEPEAVRRLVREAGETSGVYAFSDAPSGFFDRLDAHEYVYLDGTFYTTYVEKREDLPASLTAEFVDPVFDDDGARLRLALHNDGDSEIRVQSGAPRPFGVLYVRPSSADDRRPDGEDRHLLWSDAYEESDHVHTEGREVTAVNSIGLSTAVDPGESVDREFTVLPDTLPTGEYVLADEVGIDLSDDGGTFPYRVRFRLGG